ncbi:MAG: 50S ribosomal protein L30 [Chloroflexi bacterium]|jgi:large subunit ribosomal protein L30|nr:50S ribosomal protein L30 [Chloroflexota bacterium]
MTKVRVTLTKSPINQKSDQVKTLRALGLRRMGDEREHDYSRSIRGMLIKVRHLVTTELRDEGGASADA